MNNQTAKPIIKKFYLVNDSSENFFIGCVHRSDKELNEEMRNLKVGQYYNIGNGRAWLRQS